MMKKLGHKIIYYVLAGIILIFLLEIFYPRTYPVPTFNSRKGTQYWVLPDGSRIGYMFIPAKQNKKPCPIIYLHGGPGGHITDLDIKTFSSLALDGFDVYLYDQIGSGQSERLKNIRGYTVDRHIGDLNEIISKVNSDKVILIGQSWGAILATLFAADYPAKVAKIILASAGPIFPVHPGIDSLHAPDSLHLRNPVFSNAAGNKKANNIRTRAMSFFCTKLGIKIASDAEADEFATYLSYEVNKSTVCDTSKGLAKDAGSGFYAGTMTFSSLLQCKDPRQKISSLKIPVLVMKGQCDNQKWGYAEEYLRMFQNSEFALIPNAGHFISVEQPELFIRTMEKFLDK
jgi:proline iminopeptidase